MNELAKRGIAFERITEAIDMTMTSGKLVFNIFASLTDFQRHPIAERIRAGLAARRALERSGGTPPALAAKQLRKARLSLTDPDAMVMAVAKRYEVSWTTLYKGLRELAAKEVKL